MQDLVGLIKERFAEKILKVQEKAARRIYLDLEPGGIEPVAKFLFVNLRCRFATASGIDTPQGIEILYHFSHDPTGRLLTLRVIILDKQHPQIQSLALLFKGAEWIEREIWELLGVNFIGHPNLKHLLLIDDWPEGKFPLRKDKD